MAALILSVSSASFVNQAAPLRTVAPAVSTQHPVVAKLEGLVGDCPPLGFWDPAGFTKGASKEKILALREAELKHGRVAMLATFGILVAEKWHPLFGGQNSGNPWVAITQVPKLGWLQIFVFINLMEWIGELNRQRADYEPGNFLGTSQWETTEAWEDYQLRELNNGRAAMMGFVGMMTHAAITGKGPLEMTFGS